MKQDDIQRNVTDALREDLDGLSADADITANLIPAGQHVEAQVITRENCIVAGTWPETIPIKSALSIVYLALVGSALGFPLYFYLLKKLSPERVAIITLITPITALLLGAFLNGEIITNHEHGYIILDNILASAFLLRKGS